MVSEKKLNLACGQNKMEGYFGIDIQKTEAADAVMDLEQFPWDIESESAEEVFCSHYVEHTPMETYAKRVVKAIQTSESYELMKAKVDAIDLDAPSDGLILFMDEVYRILKPGGVLKVIAPYYSSMRAWQDPTHRRAICEATFLYFNKNWRNINKLDHYGIASDVDFTYGYDVESEYVSKHESAKGFAIKHYCNAVNDIHVVLTKRVIEK